MQKAASRRRLLAHFHAHVNLSYHASDLPARVAQEIVTNLAETRGDRGAPCERRRDRHRLPLDALATAPLARARHHQPCVGAVGLHIPTPEAANEEEKAAAIATAARAGTATRARGPGAVSLPLPRRPPCRTSWRGVGEQGKTKGGGVDEPALALAFTFA